MSAKQKMTIAITALCLVAVVAIVTVIAVFAANQQTFTSQISVSYTVEDVQCTVSARYYGGKDNAVTTGKDMKDPDSQKTELKFGVDLDETGTLQPEDGDVVLTSSDKFVIFEYIFKNDNEEDKAFTAELHYTGTASNVTVRTNEKGQKLTPASDFVSEPKTHFDTEKTVTENPNFTINAITVPANETVYVYVRVQISNISQDASFVGGFAWTLKTAKA